MSVLDGITAADLCDEPWPHLVVEGIELPPFPRLKPRHPEATRYQAWTCAGWDDFWVEHTSADFQEQVAGVFGEQIERLYPDLGKKRLRQVCMRTDKGLFPPSVDASIAADCQLVVNPAKDESWEIVGPHLDNPIELYAALIYCPLPGDEAQGNLQLFYRNGATPHGKQRFRREDVELAKTVPYAPGTMVMFINTPEAVHGVSPRFATDKVRRSVNIIAECRHRLYEP